MTTALTTRVTAGTGATVKGTPLTNAEIDANFLSLNDNKLETSWTGNTSIVTLGTVTTGTWNATTIAINKGGTGITTAPSSGTLLIGNSSGGYTSAGLTGTTNRITISNGSGSITLSTPQDIATSSNVQFGSLGIGTTASGGAGQIRATSDIWTTGGGLGVGTAASGTAGEIRATNAITAYYSDERLKENVKLIEGALNKVMQLRGVTYNANQLAETFGYTNKDQQVGVIAQDVEKVLPEVVKPAPFDIIRIDENTEISRSGNNYMTVQYEKMIPLLIEAIKDLKREIDALRGDK